MEEQSQELAGEARGVTVEGLQPGVEYQFRVTSQSHGRVSPSATTTVRTRPLLTSELSVITHQEVGTTEMFGHCKE